MTTIQISQADRLLNRKLKQGYIIRLLIISYNITSSDYFLFLTVCVCVATI